MLKIWDNMSEFFTYKKDIQSKRIITIPDNVTVEELMKMDLGFNYSNKELIQDWQRLKSIRTFKSGSQWKPGLKLCQQFCKNFFDIKATNGKTFKSIQSDYAEMEKVLEWGREKMSRLYISWLRKAIYMRWGGHNPTYYRPHLAKQIIYKTKKNDGILLDPCVGWGGRMLGTVSAGWKYIGCEPNIETFNNVNKIVDFISLHNLVNLYNIPFENFDLDSIDDVDIVLTSPPYFNLESYNDDLTQSYNKFNAYDDWVNNWLLKLIEVCANKLKKDGLSCWNVMDFKNTKLVDAVIQKHKDIGFELIDAIGIDSPFINYKKSLNKKDLTYIFQRK
jgi:hypothetical protein